METGGTILHTLKYGSIIFCAWYFSIPIRFVNYRKHQAAMNIEENYVRPFGKVIAGAIVFVIAAVIVFAALIVVIKITDILSRIKVVSAANSFGGLCLGVLKGIAYALLIAYVLSLIVDQSKNQLGKLNTTIIDNTYLFKYFFRIFYK